MTHFRALQCFSVKLERRVGDGIGQDVGIATQAANDHLVFQHTQISIGIDFGNARDRAWLPDNHFGDFGAQLFQNRRHFDAGGQRVELSQRHLVIGFGRIARIFAGPLDLGDFLFHRKDRIRACGAIGLARMGQHVRKEFLIRCANALKLGIVDQIHIAIRQAGTALENLEDIGLRIFIVLPDIAAEQRADAVTRGGRQKFFKRGFRLHAAHLFNHGWIGFRPSFSTAASSR